MSKYDALTALLSQPAPAKPAAKKAPKKTLKRSNTIVDRLTKSRQKFGGTVRQNPPTYLPGESW